MAPIRGQPVPVVLKGKGRNGARCKLPVVLKGEWPLPEVQLPSTLEEIERGRLNADKAQNLDDTRAGRITRLTQLTTREPIADNAGVESRNAIEVLP